MFFTFVPFSGWPMSIWSQSFRSSSAEHALCHSPRCKDFAAWTTASFALSGGPMKTCLSWCSSALRSAREMMRLLVGSIDCNAKFGTSSNMAQMWWALSNTSKLICMWYGSCRIRSARSCSCERSWNLPKESPCANNSRALLCMQTSLRQVCASWIFPKRNAHKPICAKTRLYKICMWMSDSKAFSCKLLKCNRSRASWKWSCIAK
mmetsp:Transcript_4845/g.9847  ORF Transcript_4845/g.9847 Transcript_4845/m.9847 type:complete len:206 (+) Transcript_4845:864-1481(+)